jgi:hypothetical protein
MVSVAFIVAEDIGAVEHDNPGAVGIRSKCCGRPVAQANPSFHPVRAILHIPGLHASSSRPATAPATPAPLGNLSMSVSLLQYRQFPLLWNLDSAVTFAGFVKFCRIGSLDCRSPLEARHTVPPLIHFKELFFAGLPGSRPGTPICLPSKCSALDRPRYMQALPLCLVSRYRDRI